MKQGQFFKKTKSTHFGADQRGQAVVEYILLLVVLVSMLLAAQGLFKGVNLFVSNYIGQYFTCLMDHGELPAQGVSAGSEMTKHKDQSNCLVTFSVANGATLVGAGQGSGSSNGQGKNSNSSTGNNKSTAKDPTSNTGQTSKTTAQRSGRANDGSGGVSGPNSSYANGRINRAGSGLGTADGSNDTADGKVKIIEDDQPTSAFGRSDGFGGDSGERRQSRYKAIVSGQFYDQVAKQSRRDPRQPLTKTVSKATAEEGFRPGPRKNAFMPPERKPAADIQDNDTNFGFGSMLKWLMIAGMVVAIIVFFGGQILNYSNSD